MSALPPEADMFSVELDSLLCAISGRCGRQTLLGLIKRTGIRVRELLRRKGSPYDELGLNDPKFTDDQLIDAMLANPSLINRPIVVTRIGVRPCRPSEIVLEILPAPQRGAFTKEDGEREVDDRGRGSNR
jgi:arsenate reductase